MKRARTSHSMAAQICPASCTASRTVEPNTVFGGNAPSVRSAFVVSMSANVSGLCGRPLAPTAVFTA